jgi:hypothetical protein
MVLTAFLQTCNLSNFNISSKGGETRWFFLQLK